MVKRTHPTKFKAAKAAARFFILLLLQALLSLVYGRCQEGFLTRAGACPSSCHLCHSDVSASLQGHASYTNTDSGRLPWRFL